VVDANDQRRARLNCIAHLLSLIPYEEVPREPVKFPKRQAKGDYVEPDYPFRWSRNFINRRNSHGRTDQPTKKSGMAASTVSPMVAQKLLPTSTRRKG
jgi:hypothetical protein